MPGRVDQVELVGLPVPRGVRQADGVGLDRDPALALEVHRVEDLVAEVPRRHRPAALDQAVGERRLAVVDVGDDAEVPDVVHGSLRFGRMKFYRVSLGTVACIAAWLALGSSANEAAQVVPDAGPKRLRAGHPRLLLDAVRVAELRRHVATTHRFLWERYQQDLPRMVAVSKREVPLEDARYDGDLVPELAFAWLMTGRDDLLAVGEGPAAAARDRRGPGAHERGPRVPRPRAPHPRHRPRLRLAPRGPDTGGAGDGARAARARGRGAASGGSRASESGGATSTSRTTRTRTPRPSPSPPRRCGARTRGRVSGSESPARFFEQTFAVLPEDGSSLEGYAYAGYGGEYLLLYALLARDLLGVDYTDRPWVRHFPEYLLQGLLPRRTADEWAMTFGDAPRRGWTSTAQHLFTLARLHRDGARAVDGARDAGTAREGPRQPRLDDAARLRPDAAAGRPRHVPDLRALPGDRAGHDAVLLDRSRRDARRLQVGAVHGADALEGRGLRLRHRPPGRRLRLLPALLARAVPRDRPALHRAGAHRGPQHDALQAPRAARRAGGLRLDGGAALRPLPRDRPRRDDRSLRLRRGRRDARLPPGPRTAAIHAPSPVREAGRAGGRRRGRAAGRGRRPRLPAGGPADGGRADARAQRLRRGPAGRGLRDVRRRARYVPDRGGLPRQRPRRGALLVRGRRTDRPLLDQSERGPRRPPDRGLGARRDRAAAAGSRSARRRCRPGTRLTKLSIFSDT